LLSIVNGAEVCTYTETNCGGTENCTGGCVGVTTSGVKVSYKYELVNDKLVAKSYSGVTDCSGSPASTSAGVTVEKDKCLGQYKVKSAANGLVPALLAAIGLSFAVFFF